MAKNDKQLKMEFTYTYPIKKMGTLIDPYTVSLFESFMEEKLNVGRFDVLSPSEKSKFTKVACPFCKKGFLKLLSVEPRYSGGPRPMPAALYHTANHYEFVCSNNPECKGRFIGTYTWMYID